MLQFVYAFALLESGKYCKGLVGLLHRHCDSNSEAEGKLISWCNAPAANKGIPSNNCVHFLLLVVVEFFLLLLLLFLRNEASQILMRTGFVALQIINDTSSGVQENKVWNIFFDFFVCVTKCTFSMNVVAFRENTENSTTRHLLIFAKTKNMVQ